MNTLSDPIKIAPVLTTVPAVQYTVVCYNSSLEFDRGWATTVQEIFIPSEKLGFNSTGALFQTPCARNSYNIHRNPAKHVAPLTDINLPLELVEKILLVAKLKFEYEEKQKELDIDLTLFWK